MPRNTLPIIFLVLISMNPMSLESRLTIITTDVGSVIFMSLPAAGGFIFMPGMAGMSAATPRVTALPDTMARQMTGMRFFAVNIVNTPEFRSIT